MKKFTKKTMLSHILPATIGAFAVIVVGFCATTGTGSNIVAIQQNNSPVFYEEPENNAGFYHESDTASPIRLPKKQGKSQPIVEHNGTKIINNIGDDVPNKDAVIGCHLGAVVTEGADIKIPSVQIEDFPQGVVITNNIGNTNTPTKAINETPPEEGTNIVNNIPSESINDRDVIGIDAQIITDTASANVIGSRSKYFIRQKP